MKKVVILNTTLAVIVLTSLVGCADEFKQTGQIPTPDGKGVYTSYVIKHWDWLGPNSVTTFADKTDIVQGPVQTTTICGQNPYGTPGNYQQLHLRQQVPCGQTYTYTTEQTQTPNAQIAQPTYTNTRLLGNLTNKQGGDGLINGNTVGYGLLGWGVSKIRTGGGSSSSSASGSAAASSAGGSTP